jgi:hypothetical protein
LKRSLNTRIQAYLQDAAAALSLQLRPEETASLDEPYTPHFVIGFS